MPSNQSARLDLPYLAAGQLQKHVTLNQALTRLDALAQTAVVSRSLAAQPAAPEDGDLYILPAGPTGAVWSAWAEGDLVRAELGGWTRVPAPEGALAVVLDEGGLVVRGEDGWSPFPARLQSLERLGLNTAADADNPFAAKLNKALWTARSTGDGGDGSLRFTFNKDTASDVLSLLFQSGYGGRAELGLIGDDDLRLKVSSDGGTWREALRIDKDDARVWFANGAVRAETVRLTASGDFIPPDWARLLIVTAVGGGGGGGVGAFGAGGVRQGGGGGGGGGLSQAIWRVEDLPGDLTVSLGSGGASAAAGGDTTITASGATLLTARGGQPGANGSAGGAGGASGAGLDGGNPGGAASTTATAATGASLTSPGASGGGGGGGGLDAGGVARAGGPGGDGGVLASPAPGGAGGSSAAGSVGSTPATLGSVSGGGGGGAGAVTSGAGLSGGAAGGHGAGGGGGGAGVSAGGAGGAGSAGVVVILIQG
ncbi:DUF2793 domain-containing protein [Brevundimonas sp. NIBR11]|uniref:DUF2793 domain-containing protein n=1 Tax=Brevundimonas sp. NIBR11 TaxID=3015999 RepID=UPI0022F0E3AA|nr:DUF2793 domain-containing protein [Brevundimonas sp. NIBR11]WGM30405.1 hypothetical protein KKHFBJBL_00628 [Brevundimonas sp. NIBR11]